MLRSQGPLTHLNCCHVMSLQELRDWLRSNASEVTATSAVFREKSTEVMSSIPCVFLLHPWPHGGSYLVNGVVMEVGKERPIRSGRHWGGGGGGLSPYRESLNLVAPLNLTPSHPMCRSDPS